MIFRLYGMNFECMPELKWRAVYSLVVGVTLLAVSSSTVACSVPDGVCPLRKNFASVLCS